MKRDSIKAFALTPTAKEVAKSNVVKSVLTSFKIEGVSFSPKQVASLKSRLHFSK